MSFPTEPPFAPDIQAELDDPRFTTRKHFSRATASRGCDGPLCRWAEVLRQRRRAAQKADTANREYYPNLKLQKYNNRAEEFEAAITWHLAHHVTQRGGWNRGLGKK